MNGSENSYAGALFFTLISLGALLKLNDVAGCLIGAGSALLAVISFRRALVKSAQAAEEDHQRMEIQFQQLRSKIMETSEANIKAMTSVNDAAQLVQENMSVIRERLSELDNLSRLTENSEEIKTNVISLEENSSAQIVQLEKEFERLRTVAESGTENLQAVLNLLQVIAQLIKKIDSSADTINEHVAVLGELKTIDNLRLDVARLNERLESYENLPLDASLNLSRQDLSVLKRIAAKIK